MIRRRREELGLTLIDLSVKANLSQPFLTQLENGQARPSLTSLRRLALALNTAPHRFLDRPGAPHRPQTIRREDRASVDGGMGTYRSFTLLPAEAPFRMVEFDSLPTQFLEYLDHEGFEAIYVLSGTVDVDLDGSVHSVNAGEHISYDTTIPHRMRSAGDTMATAILIESATHPPPPSPNGTGPARWA